MTVCSATSIQTLDFLWEKWYNDCAGKFAGCDDRENEGRLTMAISATCPCGAVLTAANEDALVGVAEQHEKDVHPNADPHTEAQLRAMIKEQNA